MDQIESLIFLLGEAALLAQLARVVRIPYPIFLVLGGLALGFAPGLPTVEIPPEVIFVVFLPPLLNSAAFFSSPLDLRAHLRAITLPAVGLAFAPTSPRAAVAPSPPLLPPAAFFSSPLDLRAHLRAITLLAVGLVFATTFAVAAVAHYAIGLPWAASFVLGAILAPTDPVAAEAIFRRLGVPGGVGGVGGGERAGEGGSA